MCKRSSFPAAPLEDSRREQLCLIDVGVSHLDAAAVDGRVPLRGGEW
jgi:hypothetical protein